MYYEESPFFKKTILPWYHSDGMCLIKIFFMALTMAFSVIGIQVANTLPSWYGFKGIPYALLILSGIVFFINLGRFLKRKVQMLGKAKKRY